jgi:drug/metabolite transporter (DMT)-like permease
MGKSIVHIAAFFSMLFWGFSYVWSKIVFEVYSPLTTIFFRLIISFITLFVLMFLTKQLEKIRREDYWLFAVTAIFNPFLYFIFESYGLLTVSATISAFIIATIPVFTPFVAYWIFREKLSMVNLTGLIVSFLGVMMIVFNVDFSFAAEPGGVGLLFAGVASAIIYTVFLKKLSLKYKPMTIIGWENLLGTFYFMPLFFYFDFEETRSIIPTREVVISLILLGTFASSFAYSLFAYVVKHIGISKGNLYSNLIAVFAALASYVVLKEQFTTFKLTGMAIIISGVLLSQLENNPFRSKTGKRTDIQSE